MAWVLGSLEDVASDLSAFHRIWVDPDTDDYGTLSGPRFFALAARLHHYSGAVRGAILMDAQKRQQEAPSGPIGIDVTPEMLRSGLDKQLGITYRTGEQGT